MIEHKFRGKRADNKGWVDGFVEYHLIDGDLSKTKKRVFITCESMNEIGKVYRDTYEVYQKSVGKYIGLPDKSGKEICDGDIVLAVYGKWREEPNGLRRICKVIYDKRTCSYRMAVLNSKVLVSFSDSKSEDIEIIGNYFDNPNLFNTSMKDFTEGGT